ncbi:hypothetical protein AK812_SmicGene24297 [Symbiodinium microadriaticum]|uniref:Uncharacterized protein n=1 Tax=Symbiodinium microadriaticum TaxID=2951 RepID=A0A1Q9DF00_SYMMI|nr:hypothetical protein AK812_SmicGene24297 [Symbiodinium microadriaticum]
MACTGLLASVFGLSCLGSVFKLPVADRAQLGPPLSTQSRLLLGLRVLALDFGKSGSCLSLRAVGRFGPNLPVFGFVKLNYAETVSIADYINFGLQIPLRSFARLGFPASVALRASVDSTLPLRDPFFDWEVQHLPVDVSEQGLCQLLWVAKAWVSRLCFDLPAARALLSSHPASAPVAVCFLYGHFFNLVSSRLYRE